MTAGATRSSWLPALAISLQRVVGLMPRRLGQLDFAAGDDDRGQALLRSRGLPDRQVPDQCRSLLVPTLQRQALYPSFS